MNQNSLFSFFVRWCLCAGGLCSFTAAHAQLLYHVDVNTASLVGSPSAPFALDFQLIDGSGGAFNTVILSNFTFGGGSATGSSIPTGGATGNLSTTVTLTDTSFFNELYQSISVGNSIGFDVSMTLNDELGTPDAFSFSILDASLVNIPTSGPGDSLLYANITSTIVGSDIQVASGAGLFSGVTVAPIPEPVQTGFLGALFLGGISLTIRRFSAKH